MPNITPLQNDFSSGEITPELYVRTDLTSRERRRIYQSAAREVLNFWSDSRGPLRSRDGFRFVSEVIPAGGGPVLQCGEAVSFDTGELEGAIGPVSNITVHGNRLVVSKLGAGGSFGVVGTFDLPSGPWTRRRIGFISGSGSTRDGAYHFSGSGLGLIEQNTHIYSMIEGSSNFTPVTNIYHDVAADWSQDPALSAAFGSVGSDMEFFDESPNYIAIGFQNADTVRIMPKTNFGLANFIYGPAGYNLQGLAWSKTLSSWLVFLEKESSPFTTQGISIVPTTNEGDIGGDVNVDPPTEFFTFNGYQANIQRGSWKDGEGNIYFAFSSNDYRSATNPGAAHNSFFQKVTNSGVAIRTYDSDDTKDVSPLTMSNSTTFSGQTAMTYDPSRNRTTGSLGGTILQLDHVTDEWSSCVVPGVPADTVGAAVDINGFLWGAPRPQPITLYRHEIYA